MKSTSNINNKSPPKTRSNQQIIDPDSKVLVLDEVNCVMYHGSCYDGFGSAFVIWMYIKETQGLEKANDIMYIPCYHNDDNEKYLLEQIRNKNVLMCDFSYQYKRLVRLINEAKSFLILDHHKSAAQNLEAIPDNLKIFDMNRSGVGITWDTFYPAREMPLFLTYIQDRDLWTNKFADTNSFICYFYEQDQNFELFETFLQKEVVDNAVNKGSNWREYQDIMIDKISRKSHSVIHEIDGQYCIVAYSNNSELKSDVGNRIFKYRPYADFSCVWEYNHYRNQTYCSLRSTDNRFDVSKIANRLGGGGHRNAAGCNMSGCSGVLPFKVINNPQILDLLRYAEKGKINLRDDNNIREEKYVIMKTNELEQEWLFGKYINLIKRKFSDCKFIIFETPCDDTEGVYEYHILFNDLVSEIDSVTRLVIEAHGSEEYVMTIRSEKTFDQMLEDIINPLQRKEDDSTYESNFESIFEPLSIDYVSDCSNDSDQDNSDYDSDDHNNSDDN